MAPPGLLRFTTLECADFAGRLADGASDEGRERDVERAFLAALDSARVGRPYTFLEQHGGRLVQDVRPTPEHEDDISSSGRVPFPLHTDDAFLEAGARPHRLALLGVRNPGRVPTIVVELDDVLSRLGDDTVAALERPAFEFRCPDSFAVGEERVYSAPPRPVLRRDDAGRHELTLATRTRPAPSAPADADAHLRRLRSAIGATRSAEILLDPGEILVVSNSRCLHGRDAIRGDRWLKRIYLRDDLAALDAVAATGRPGIYRATDAVEHMRRNGAAW